MAHTIKLRFCPSPTGFIHMGNARTALFNGLYALGHAGVFLLRIEDTDRERSKDEYTQQLKQDLQWLGLQWQEGPDVGGDNGPYWQSQRQAIYDGFYDKIIEKKLAYPCFCSEEKLAVTRKVQRAAGQPPRYPGTCRNLSKDDIDKKLAAGEKPSLRFRIPNDASVEFEDVVKGIQRFQTNDIGDFIIRRQNGTAPFMYCNAIDDAMMGVTHVVRGEDHLTNSPRQMLILQALELPTPTYCHISLIVGPDGSPLSKRHGSRSIADLKQAGFLPAALQNYMARLGHYYEDNSLLSLQQLAEKFEFSRLSTSPAKYNEEQLHYWQKEALAALSDAQVWAWVKPFVKEYVDADKHELFTSVVRANITFPEDARRWAQLFFADTLELDDDAKTILNNVDTAFFKQAAMIWQQDHEDFKTFTKAVQQATGVKGKQLFQPLRIAISGAVHGPELNPLADLLGKERIAQRLLQAKAQCD